MASQEIEFVRTCGALTQAMSPGLFIVMPGSNGVSVASSKFIYAQEYILVPGTVGNWTNGIYGEWGVQKVYVFAPSSINHSDELLY